MINGPGSVRRNIPTTQQWPERQVGRRTK